MGGSLIFFHSGDHVHVVGCPIYETGEIEAYPSYDHNAYRLALCFEEFPRR